MGYTMRDLYYDEGFVRDFVKASKQWSWVTWHQNNPEQSAQSAHDEAALRLLRQAFPNPQEREEGSE